MGLYAGKRKGYQALVRHFVSIAHLCAYACTIVRLKKPWWNVELEEGGEYLATVRHFVSKGIVHFFVYACTMND